MNRGEGRSARKRIDDRHNNDQDDEAGCEAAAARQDRRHASPALFADDVDDEVGIGRYFEGHRITRCEIHLFDVGFVRRAIGTRVRGGFGIVWIWKWSGRFGHASTLCDHPDMKSAISVTTVVATSL